LILVCFGRFILLNSAHEVIIMDKEEEQKKEVKAKTILRQIRDSLVAAIIALTRVVFFWVPGGDAAHGQALMVLHPIIVGAVIFLFFALPIHHPGRLIILSFSLVVMASQWLFGCVITRAEQKLTGNNETIVDPFLGLANVTVNRDTRMAATLAVGTTIASIMVIIVAFDAFLH